MDEPAPSRASVATMLISEEFFIQEDAPTAHRSSAKITWIFFTEPVRLNGGKKKLRFEIGIIRISTAELTFFGWGGLKDREDYCNTRRPMLLRDDAGNDQIMRGDKR